MIKSMTGFGRATKSDAKLNCVVEVKSVNHRFCEIQVRMPRQLLVFEDKIKKAINQYVHRGRVELYISVEGEDIVKRKLKIDWDLMDQYYQNLLHAKKRYSLEENITLQQLFEPEDLSSIIEEDTKNEHLETLIIDTVDTAMKQLKEMRELEGQQLYHDIKEQIIHITNHVTDIAELAPRVVSQYHERIRKKVNEYVEGVIDESKIVTDVAIFAEKADITEEITRLKSHISQFLETLHIEEVVGRKLDFLLQEMNRETNTIGAKANDHIIAKQVVEVKSLLEKIKEQIQNIE